MPRKIGVITSDTGAALRDIINVTSRRFPLAEILLHPALVQGLEAPKSLIKALDAMYKTDADVIIIGRGGGSAEDLSPFNDEQLARKIATSPVPVISAVGHETDFSICDFVSDMRAPTPSAAAELAVPDKAELLDTIRNYRQRAAKAAASIVRENGFRLQALATREVLKYPQRYFEIKMQRVDELCFKAKAAYEDILKTQASRFGVAISKLSALNPINVIKRGYAEVLKEGNHISSVKNLTAGDKLKIRLSDGFVNCSVENTEV